MPTVTGTIRKQLLMPDLSEVTFEKRGFHARNPQTQQVLEHIGAQFLRGFGYGMTSRDLTEAGHLLDSVERPFRGFAYEGASMAFAITDAITPWGRYRLRAFMEGPAARHIYMAYVGAGWAMARLPRRLWRAFILPDCLLRWLALDGYGFHQAYFATQSHVMRREIPRVSPPWPDPHGYASRAVDQGIGRALWFVCGADAERISAVIAEFTPARRADLWSGAGLACVYAGGVEPGDLPALLKLGAAYRAELAQGAVFAAKARLLADLVTRHTVEAVGALCELSVQEAAEIADTALAGLPPDGLVPAFEIWRQRIQARVREAVG